MKKLFVLTILMLAVSGWAQIVINIQYDAPDGNAVKYMEEMTSSGIADSIRNIPGCLRYDYFISQSNPQRVLLIDSWEDKSALDRYHQSPFMKQAETLRDKYQLKRNIEVFTPAKMK